MSARKLQIPVVVEEVAAAHPKVAASGERRWLGSVGASRSVYEEGGHAKGWSELCSLKLRSKEVDERGLCRWLGLTILGPHA